MRDREIDWTSYILYRLHILDVIQCIRCKPTDSFAETHEFLNPDLAMSKLNWTLQKHTIPRRLNKAMKTTMWKRFTYDIILYQKSSPNYHGHSIGMVTPMYILTHFLESNTQSFDDMGPSTSSSEESAYSESSDKFKFLDIFAFFVGGVTSLQSTQRVLIGRNIKQLALRGPSSNFITLANDALFSMIRWRLAMSRIVFLVTFSLGMMWWPILLYVWSHGTPVHTAPKYVLLVMFLSWNFQLNQQKKHTDVGVQPVGFPKSKRYRSINFCWAPRHVM